MAIGVDHIRRALNGRAHVPMSRSAAHRLAAVAAIVRDGAEGAEVLLIRRAKHDRDPWSGHMAFPGGRYDEADVDLLETAVRETHEEVGLRLDRAAHLVGRLDDQPVYAQGRPIDMIIAPFVFAVVGDPVLTAASSEVEEILWTPLTPLVLGERNTTLSWEHEGGPVVLPGYDVDGRVVWGLTHRMLGVLFAQLDAELTTRYGSAR